MVEGMKVSVVGGSLGGLTAACLLRDAGFEVDVFERSPVRLEQRGAGIGFLPATYRYLHERAGVDLTKISVPTSRIRYLDASGNIIHDEPHRYLFSSWNTVYATTLDHFGLSHYHLGFDMERFSQTDNSATVSFKNEQVVTSDLLVAADGIGSIARKTLIASSRTQYAGYVAWRGMIAESKLSAEVLQCLGDAITYFVYPHSHILVYPIPDHDGRVTPGDRLINFVWYCNYAAGDEFTTLMTDKHGVLRDVSVPLGFVAQHNVDAMKEMARQNLPPILSDIVQATPEPFVQVIYDIEIDQMAFGRVCLLGDAAMVARPHAAAGTAKAAADAWALTEALQTHSSVAQALQAYESSQLALARNLLERTRRVGAKSQFLNTWDPKDPEVIFGLHRPGD